MNRFRIYLSKFKFYKLAHNIKSRFIDIEKRDAIKSMRHKINANKEAALFVFTPTHDNLGDHAIAYSTIQLFKKSNFDYIEITDRELRLLERIGKLNIFNGRIIILNGGGYLGTLWPEDELLARKIVKSNPKSKIVFLPNTIFYENTSEDQTELEKSKQIYNNHKNIVFYARERKSYEYMKNVYNNVMLCPDMVLSLNEQDEAKKRNGCLVCLRSDIEKTLNEAETESISKQVKNVFDSNYNVTDMYSKSIFNVSERKNILQGKFNEFRTAQLVITDRLHGMIFSAITGTPCIVINSKSPKIKGCYEWIENLNYIRFCDDVSDIPFIMKELLIIKNCKFDNSCFSSYYIDLMKLLKDESSI